MALKVRLTETERVAAQTRVARYNAAQETLGRSIRVKFDGTQYRMNYRGRSSWHSRREIDQYIRNLEHQIAYRDRLGQ